MESHSVIIKKLLSIIPFLSPDKYKGQNGKIAVIGGCFEYTGAPYYAALSALKGGCDLSHIFCTYDAGIPLKSFSPELIIHPTLLDENNIKKIFSNEKIKEIFESFTVTTKWFNSFHSFVIGPGLGRDSVLAQLLPIIIKEIASNQVGIFDADLLWYLINNEKLTSILKSRSQYNILTPNAVEFNRLWDKFCSNQTRTNQNEIEICIKEIESKTEEIFELPIDYPLVRESAILSQSFDNLTIFQKGKYDIITNGKKCYVVKSKGSLKRCGGQGDILAGLIGVYSYWSINSKIEENSLLYGCLMASLVARQAAKLAFEKETISLISPKIMDYIGQSFNNIFGETYYAKTS